MFPHWSVTIKMCLVVALLSSKAWASSTPGKCTDAVQILFQSGHLKYRPIQWITTPFDPKYHERRSIEFDIFTGKQTEVIEQRVSIDSFPSEFNDVVREYIHYTLVDPITGKKRAKKFRYEANQKVSIQDALTRQTPSFYAPAVDFNPQFQKLFPVKHVSTPTREESAQFSLTTPPSNSVTETKIVYLDYPEVQVHGAVGENHYKSKTTGVELYALNGKLSNGQPVSSGKAVRIVTSESGNMTKEIYDIVAISGDHPPGISKKVLPLIPPELKNDFINLINRLQNQISWGSYEKALERLLLVSGIELEKYKKMSDDLLEAGKKKQTAFVQDILDFITPLYRDRRGWDARKIHDFRANAYKTMNDTRYIRIKNSKGKTVAALGITSATYGVIKFYDRNSRSYVEVMGPFGAPFVLSKSGRDLLSDQLPVPDFWHHPVDLLPIETEGFEIPRPHVYDGGLGISKEEVILRLENDVSLKEKGFDIDLNQPIFMSVGRVLEPVKFGVAKNLEDMGISNVEVLTQMLLALFPQEFSDKFNNDGQLLATYNTREGVRMYRALGFEVSPDKPSKIMGGQEWFAMSATPKSVYEAIRKIKYMKSEEAEAILDFLSTRLK